MKITVSVFLLFYSLLSYGQDSKLSVFNNLISKTWEANGHWDDGIKFTQKTDFKYSLDSTIVVTNSIGYIDKEQTKLGLRNLGIRKFDKETNNTVFWEFDIYGDLTEGIVYSEGKNIIYKYDYDDSTFSEMWEYIDESTYNFIVGNYENGIWQKIYLSTQFNLVKEK